MNLGGVLVTRYGHAVPTSRIRILEAAHPVPDANSEAAARTILAGVAGMTADDLVIALLSDGGSATLALPAPRLTLDDKRAVKKARLHSGASIGEVNLVRAALSGIKGDRLARAAAPARVITLAISDVPCDDPITIASGPTCAPVPDSRAVEAILSRDRITVPDRVTAFLARGRAGAPKQRAPDRNAIHCARSRSRDGRGRWSDAASLMLGDALEGENRDCGALMAGVARSIASRGHPAEGLALVLSGGETTVTIPDGEPGRGGRNTEFLLGFCGGARPPPRHLGARR